ncbi:MAG: tyrosine-type recombinase/integrase [Clostridia bacterium]|nr:tyrosine-type recombinase/integrase [Clostridia bacterium]
MRDQLRNELLAAIGEKMGTQDLQIAGKVIDGVLANYDVKPAEKHLALLGRDELEKLIKTYIVVRRMEGISDTTLYGYMRTLRCFMLGVRKPVGELTANDVRLFLYEYQDARGISNRSLDSVRIVVCSFLRWAASEKYIPSNPVEMIRPIKYERKPRKAVTQLELEMLRRGCRDDRELALLETMYSTACRVSELIGIKLSDIDWDTRTVTLFGKGKKYRSSYLNAKSEIAIKAYLHRRKHDSIFLFCNDRGGEKMTKSNVERIMRGIAQRAGLGDRKISPHVMRHTTATQALTSGMPITDIQKLLGHENVNTTMVYAKVNQDDVRGNHQKYIV